jgi:hypothetical protein
MWEAFSERRSALPRLLIGGRRPPPYRHLPKIVTAMTLRHTHAIACLRAGMFERELQVRHGKGLPPTVFRRILLAAM